MSTAVLRSQDALKFRFHANAFGYRPPRPPMNSRRRQPPAPSPSPAPATCPPPPHKSKHTGPTPTSRSPPPKPDQPAPARPGRKPRPTAGAGKDNDGGGGGADERRHHRRRLVMEEVTILKRGEAMKPSGPVLPRSNRGDDQAVDPVYAGPGYSVTSPPPSSVPYPAFLQSSLAASEEATRSLLRLLRLNQFAP